LPSGVAKGRGGAVRPWRHFYGGGTMDYASGKLKQVAKYAGVSCYIFPARTFALCQTDKAQLKKCALEHFKQKYLYSFCVVVSRAVITKTVVMQ